MVVLWIVLPALLFPYLIGILTIFYWCKEPKYPADSTNRINNIKSWWIGLTRTDVLARCYKSQRLDVMQQLNNGNDD